LAVCAVPAGRTVTAAGGSVASRTVLTGARQRAVGPVLTAGARLAAVDTGPADWTTAMTSSGVTRSAVLTRAVLRAVDAERPTRTRCHTANNKIHSETVDYAPGAAARRCHTANNKIHSETADSAPGAAAWRCHTVNNKIRSETEDFAPGAAARRCHTANNKIHSETEDFAPGAAANKRTDGQTDRLHYLFR